jgi:hypothetical protein
MHSRELEPHTKISNQLSPRNQKCLGQECRRGCARLRWREARTKTSSRTRRFDPSLPEHSLQGGGYLRPGWTGYVTLASPVPSHAGHFDSCNDIFSLRLSHMNHSLGTRNDTLTPSSAPALHAPCRYAELNSCCRRPNQWRHRCKSFRQLYQDRLSCPQANTVTYFEKSELIAGHEPPVLWAIVNWVIMIRWRSRRSHVQFARVERQNRSTLTLNSDKRSVIVHATPPLGWINGTGTSGHLKENQRRSDHECKGYFHWKSFRTRL